MIENVERKSETEKDNGERTPGESVVLGKNEGHTETYTDKTLLTGEAQQHCNTVLNVFFYFVYLGK